MTTSKERPQAAPGSPTDLELMMYFDGELEEPRKSAVAAFVAADLGAKNKLAGLRITSAFVQDQAPDLSRADDIADRILARIAAEPAETPAESAKTAKVIAFPSKGAKAPGARPAKAKPANDNVRRIFGVAALAVAAAAALAIWGRQHADGPGAPLHDAPVAVSSPSNVPSSPGSPASPSTQPQVDVASVTPEVAEEHGVEVAAVSFGAHMGSIFYVPSGSIEANHTTTVVWLADDAGE